MYQQIQRRYSCNKKLSRLPLEEAKSRDTLKRGLFKNIIQI